MTIVNNSSIGPWDPSKIQELIGQQIHDACSDLRDIVAAMASVPPATENDHHCRWVMYDILDVLHHQGYLDTSPYTAYTDQWFPQSYIEVYLWTVGDPRIYDLLRPESRTSSQYVSLILSLLRRTPITHGSHITDVSYVIPRCVAYTVRWWTPPMEVRYDPAIERYYTLLDCKDDPNMVDTQFYHRFQTCMEVSSPDIQHQAQMLMFQRYLYLCRRALFTHRMMLSDPYRVNVLSMMGILHTLTTTRWVLTDAVHR